MMEYEHEPIRGLPGDLPAGEHILWQGAPDWRLFAASGLFTRWIGAYFAILAAFALAAGQIFASIATIICGAVTLGLLSLFAGLVQRTTVYTITNRRVVLRIGVALNKCINLPLSAIAGADLRALGNGSGDIALTLGQKHRLGYAMLWPHARPFRFGSPQPMLRALPDAAEVAAILARACSAQVTQPSEHPAVATAALVEAAA